MTRDIPFEENAICDECGRVGAYDFMGDFYCPGCIEIAELLKDLDGILKEGE